MRYTVRSRLSPIDAVRSIGRLKRSMGVIAPFQEIWFDWIVPKPSTPWTENSASPFRAEFDVGSLPRHKTNLIFAACGLVDALMQKGYKLEAKRFLCEAMLLEPNAKIVRERLRALS
jgi:hypothetical protein